MVLKRVHFMKKNLILAAPSFGPSNLVYLKVRGLKTKKTYADNSLNSSCWNRRRSKNFAAVEILLVLLPVVAEMSEAIQEEVGRDQDSDDHVDGQVPARSAPVVDENDELHPTCLEKNIPLDLDE